MYENALKEVVEAAKLLEGEKYPSASSVIPFLDTIFDSLKSLILILEGDGKAFVEKLLYNLKSNKRFPEGYKELSPYNSLTLMDLRYADLYFSVLQCEKAKGDLENDAIFDEL